MNYPALLCAIALVETGVDDHAVGAHGERGRYQISEVVWKQHSHLHFDFAHDPITATSVANTHLRWLVKHEVLVLPDHLAFAWHHGLLAYCRHHTKYGAHIHDDFSTRVLNIYSLTPQCNPLTNVSAKLPSGGTNK